MRTREMCGSTCLLDLLGNCLAVSTAICVIIMVVKVEGKVTSTRGPRVET